MQRRESLVTGETYHIYNRGAHKVRIFTNEEDYRRFLMLLYVLNTTESIVMRDILSKYIGRSYVNVFSEERDSQRLVSVHAYCLMPNHFHLLLTQKTADGVTLFLRKVSTSYSMYFNTKYEHSGVLFQGRFKSKYIGSESYMRWLYSYIHLNPIELIEHDWKERGIVHKAKVRDFVNNYKYSSFLDYRDARRPESAIVALEDFPDFLKQQNDLEDLLTILQRTVLCKSGDKFMKIVTSVG